MLRNFPKQFQWLPDTRGNSMQHGRDMKAPKKKPAAAKLRSWRVSIIRKRGQYLGTVEAPNEKAAEAAAVVEFDLGDEQRKRLVVQRVIRVRTKGCARSYQPDLLRC
jgi:hypothetical protein